MKESDIFLKQTRTIHHKAGKCHLKKANSKEFDLNMSFHERFNVFVRTIYTD